MEQESAIPSRDTPAYHCNMPERDTYDGDKVSAPRTIASLRLTDQARLLLDSKRPGEAIRILERAINLDPNNGQNYYLLAEAWFVKENWKQAIEFNRIAGIYLDNDEFWTSMVHEQRARIENALTDK